jgi:hypothetical protein
MGCLRVLPFAVLSMVLIIIPASSPSSAQQDRPGSVQGRHHTEYYAFYGTVQRSIAWRWPP